MCAPCPAGGWAAGAPQLRTPCPALPRCPPASAEPLRGCSPEQRAAAGIRGGSWRGAERSGAGERHKREGRRESPSHAPLPQVYDGGPEEQCCSAATARLLKTCCSAFLGKVDAYCVFSLCFLVFFFFFFSSSSPALVGAALRRWGVCEGGFEFGEGLWSQRVPGGAGPCVPPGSQVRAARVSAVSPLSPSGPLRDRASMAIVFPRSCGDSPGSGLLPGPPCPGSRSAAGLPKASTEFVLFF